MKLSLSLLLLSTTTAFAFTIPSTSKSTKLFAGGFGKKENPPPTSPEFPTSNIPSTGLLPGMEPEEDLFKDMTPARRANLFQSLLRDLQVEGTPVLGCDAKAVHTMSAALWTTLAEMSENDEESKTCLVLEEIPIPALMAFVEDFTVLKTQERLIAYLPELKRLSVSLVGKGAGPAFVLEASKRTEEELEEKKGRNGGADTDTDTAVVYNEEKCTKALQSFIDRVVVNEEACPYTKSINLAAVGLESRGVPPGGVGYRYNGASDACAAVGVFWNSVCELLSTPQEEISTTMLSLPGIGAGTDEEALFRFNAVAELISRNLCLFRGDDVFGLVHFHPAYDRTAIHPVDKPAYGHLPPRGWLRPMLKMNGNVQEAEASSSEGGLGLSDEELNLSDFQRKSPFTAINILRVNQLNAASGAKSIVDLEVGEGVTEKASGITTYSRNAIRLAGVGEEKLQAGLDADIAMMN